MTDDDLELLHRFVDGEISAEEAAEFEARLETSPELAGEREELMQLSAMLRQDISNEVDAVDFSQFYAGIEAQLPVEVFSATAV
jgi:anti-sigma factor RsiW